ncbi:helix-turn-helix domain-containing protein [Myxococcaceae bacterium JPH2]|nr:helix-turn-helix domain-containing protein [Myxococcaceae bacterium JPH2]
METQSAQFEDGWEVERAAQFLGISPRTLYRLTNERKVPHYKVGGALRFEPSKLRAWRAAGGSDNAQR